MVVFHLYMSPALSTWSWEWVVGALCFLPNPMLRCFQMLKFHWSLLRFRYFLMQYVFLQPVRCVQQRIVEPPVIFPGDVYQRESVAEDAHYDCSPYVDFDCVFKFLVSGVSSFTQLPRFSSPCRFSTALRVGWSVLISIPGARRAFSI